MTKRPPHAAGRAKLLDTPASLWEAVTSRGGLDLRYHSDMDEDIVETLLTALGVPRSSALSSVLEDPALTVERFLGALLEALNPFSAMLSDLLRMFERAGATRTDHSLKIDFDFGNAPKLSFDLRQFRGWMESVQQLRESVRVARWSYATLWDLFGALRPDTNSPQKPPWVIEYETTRSWPTFELPQPASGDAALDAALSRCFAVWSLVVSETSRFGRSRLELHEAGGPHTAESNEEGGRWSMRFLARVDRDNWAGSVAAAMHGIASLARSLPEPERRAFIGDRLRRIEDLFARVPRMTIDVDQARSVLLAFLDLPIWPRRHELYSAWVMTLIADALADDGLHFHHDGGALSFAFRGSHLATTEATLPRVHVWAELRSPLVEQSVFSGRRHIQPDYTLVAEPVTSPKSAVVVVECKQYRRFSKRNFSHAVADYANGRPNACIVLAAYGPARADFLQTLSPALAERIILLGHLRPGDPAARNRFSTTLRQAVASRVEILTGAAERPRLPLERVESEALKAIALTWHTTPRDLDLHLLVWGSGSWTTVDFRTGGSGSDFPWAQLDRDVRDGHGPETMVVSKLLDTNYRCYVENYSGESSLSDSSAEVVIAFRDSEARLSCPRAGAGSFWYIFDFDAPKQKFIIVNRITDLDPGTTPPGV